MNCINTDYFKPFLQAFCEKTQPLYTCGYPWGPFVPYTMPRYNDADVKIFYMGGILIIGWSKKNFSKLLRIMFWKTIWGKTRHV